MRNGGQAILPVRPRGVMRKLVVTPSVSGRVLAENALRRFISPGSLQRGDSYYRDGRVRRVEDVGEGLIEADVAGSRLYSVILEVDGGRLIVSCDCPWFVGQFEECKHIWAAIRAASARQLLPERPLQLEIGETFGEDDFDDYVPITPFQLMSTVRGRDHRPQWQRFLESLPKALATQGMGRPIPDEIAYAILSFPRAPHLALRIIGRTRKKNGEWGKWKPVTLAFGDVSALTSFDRESIGLLNQSNYDIESTITISHTMTAWWVERLARAGQLFVMASADLRDLQPITWDDGPPWTFSVAVANDATKSRYLITGSIERDGESLPLERVDAVIAGVLFSRGRASRFDDGGRTAWLQALGASGPIEIPHADTERFRQALVRAPIANIPLPEELGWSIIDVRPRPLLALQHDAWSAEMRAELFFVYDEWRAASRSAEMQTTIGRKLIRRDRAAEETFRTRLAALGIIGGWDGYYRFRAGQFDELARKLAAEGWALEMDSIPVRVADDIDLEISSGIDWFDLDVSAAFGELRVALPELLAAAEAKRSLLRLSDGSFGIVPASWTESLAPVLELGTRKGNAVRFVPAQALLIDALLQSRKSTTDRAFVELRQRITDASPEPRQEPPTLTAELRPYQRAGLGWLHFLRDTGLGGCLADDMGLGKTVQTLALLEELRAGGNERPSLVVAPRSLLFNWAAEAQRFAPQLRVLEHHGNERASNVFTGCDVVLTTYATMRLDVARLAETEFEYVILDESQAIKNASSQVAKAVRLLRARHRLALSGTPIENHLGELWSLFEFLDPGLLGSMRSFNRTFASKNAPPERRDALARGLRPLILRRTKEQVAPELPERIEQTLYCELEGKQKKLYDELRDHYRQALLGRVKRQGLDKSRMQILEALLRLRQAACDPGLIDPDTDASSAKIDLLMNELEDVLTSGHRALIFSQFTSFLEIVRATLDEADIEYLYLDGKTRDRQSLVEQFQSASGPPLFLISLKAGGLGLNLTNADYIFLLDPWWNPAVEAQAIDRAHRIGRQKPVVAYRLIARDTVEEKILELQARKRELAESIISEDNSVLRRLEVEDLELLLS
jgi:superfamily II DNA or RNA helicase